MNLHAPMVIASLILTLPEGFCATITDIENTEFIAKIKKGIKIEF